VQDWNHVDALWELGCLPLLQAPGSSKLMRSRVPTEEQAVKAIAAVFTIKPVLEQAE
jgi:hypothetical protein